MRPSRHLRLANKTAVRRTGTARLRARALPLLSRWAARCGAEPPFLRLGVTRMQRHRGPACLARNLNAHLRARPLPHGPARHRAEAALLPAHARGGHVEGGTARLTRPARDELLAKRPSLPGAARASLGALAFVCADAARPGACLHLVVPRSERTSALSALARLSLYAPCSVPRLLAACRGAVPLIRAPLTERCPAEFAVNREMKPRFSHGAPYNQAVDQFDGPPVTRQNEIHG
jgi:hypothetical protein